MKSTILKTIQEHQTINYTVARYFKLHFGPTNVFAHTFNLNWLSISYLFYIYIFYHTFTSWRSMCHIVILIWHIKWHIYLNYKNVIIANFNDSVWSFVQFYLNYFMHKLLFNNLFFFYYEKNIYKYNLTLVEIVININFSNNNILEKVHYSVLYSILKKIDSSLDFFFNFNNLKIISLEFITYKTMICFFLQFVINVLFNKYMNIHNTLIFNIYKTVCDVWILVKLIKKYFIFMLIILYLPKIYNFKITINTLLLKINFKQSINSIIYISKSYLNNFNNKVLMIQKPENNLILNIPVVIVGLKLISLKNSNFFFTTNEHTKKINIYLLLQIIAVEIKVYVKILKCLILIYINSQWSNKKIKNIQNINIFNKLNISIVNYSSDKSVAANSINKKKLNANNFPIKNYCKNYSTLLNKNNLIVGKIIVPKDSTTKISYLTQEEGKSPSPKFSQYSKNKQSRFLNKNNTQNIKNKKQTSARYELIKKQYFLIKRLLKKSILYKFLIFNFSLLIKIYIILYLFYLFLDFKIKNYFRRSKITKKYSKKKNTMVLLFQNMYKLKYKIPKLLFSILDRMDRRKERGNLRHIGNFFYRHDTKVFVVYCIFHSFKELVKLFIFLILLGLYTVMNTNIQLVIVLEIIENLFNMSKYSFQFIFDFEEDVYIFFCNLFMRYFSLIYMIREFKSINVDFGMLDPYTQLFAMQNIDLQWLTVDTSIGFMHNIFAKKIWNAQIDDTYRIISNWIHKINLEHITFDPYSELLSNPNYYKELDLPEITLNLRELEETADYTTKNFDRNNIFETCYNIGEFEDYRENLNNYSTLEPYHKNLDSLWRDKILIKNDPHQNSPDMQNLLQNKNASLKNLVLEEQEEYHHWCGYFDNNYITLANHTNLTNSNLVNRFLEYIQNYHIRNYGWTADMKNKLNFNNDILELHKFKLKKSLQPYVVIPKVNENRLELAWYFNNKNYYRKKDIEFVYSKLILLKKIQNKLNTFDLTRESMYKFEENGAVEELINLFSINKNYSDNEYYLRNKIILKNIKIKSTDDNGEVKYVIPFEVSEQTIGEEPSENDETNNQDSYSPWRDLSYWNRAWSAVGHEKPLGPPPSDIVTEARNRTILTNKAIEINNNDAAIFEKTCRNIKILQKQNKNVNKLIKIMEYDNNNVIKTPNSKVFEFKNKLHQDKVVYIPDDVINKNEIKKYYSHYQLFKNHDYLINDSCLNMSDFSPISEKYFWNLLLKYQSKYYLNSIKNKYNKIQNRPYKLYSYDVDNNLSNIEIISNYNLRNLKIIHRLYIIYIQDNKKLNVLVPNSKILKKFINSYKLFNMQKNYIIDKSLITDNYKYFIKSNKLKFKKISLKIPNNKIFYNNKNGGTNFGSSPLNIHNSNGGSGGTDSKNQFNFIISFIYKNRKKNNDCHNYYKYILVLFYKKIKYTKLNNLYCIWNYCYTNKISLTNFLNLLNKILNEKQDIKNQLVLIPKNTLIKKYPRIVQNVLNFEHNAMTNVIILNYFSVNKKMLLKYTDTQFKIKNINIIVIYLYYKYMFMEKLNFFQYLLSYFYIDDKTLKAYNNLLHKMKEYLHFKNIAKYLIINSRISSYYKNNIKNKYIHQNELKNIPLIYINLYNKKYIIKKNWLKLYHYFFTNYKLNFFNYIFYNYLGYNLKIFEDFITFLEKIQYYNKIYKLIKTRCIRTNLIEKYLINLNPSICTNYENYFKKIYINKLYQYYKLVDNAKLGVLRKHQSDDSLKILDLLILYLAINEINIKIRHFLNWEMLTDIKNEQNIYDTDLEKKDCQKIKYMELLLSCVTLIFRVYEKNNQNVELYYSNITNFEPSIVERNFFDITIKYVTIIIKYYKTIINLILKNSILSLIYINNVSYMNTFIKIWTKINLINFDTLHSYLNVLKKKIHSINTYSINNLFEYLKNLPITIKEIVMSVLYLTILQINSILQSNLFNNNSNIFILNQKNKFYLNHKNILIKKYLKYKNIKNFDSDFEFHNNYWYEDNNFIFNYRSGYNKHILKDIDTRRFYYEDDRSDDLLWFKLLRDVDVKKYENQSIKFDSRLYDNTLFKWWKRADAQLRWGTFIKPRTVNSLKWSSFIVIATTDLNKEESNFDLTKPQKEPRMIAYDLEALWTVVLPYVGITKDLLFYNSIKTHRQFMPIAYKKYNPLYKKCHNKYLEIPDKVLQNGQYEKWNILYTRAKIAVLHNILLKNNRKNIPFKKLFYELPQNIKRIKKQLDNLKYYNKIIIYSKLSTIQKIMYFFKKIKKNCISLYEIFNYNMKYAIQIHINHLDYRSKPLINLKWVRSENENHWQNFLYFNLMDTYSINGISDKEWLFLYKLINNKTFLFRQNILDIIQFMFSDYFVYNKKIKFWKIIKNPLILNYQISEKRWDKVILSKPPIIHNYGFKNGGLFDVIDIIQNRWSDSVADDMYGFWHEQYSIFNNKIINTAVCDDDQVIVIENLNLFNNINLFNFNNLMLDNIKILFYKIYRAFDYYFLNYNKKSYNYENKISSKIEIDTLTKISRTLSNNNIMEETEKEMFVKKLYPTNYFGLDIKENSFRSFSSDLNELKNTRSTLETILREMDSLGGMVTLPHINSLIKHFKKSCNSIDTLKEIIKPCTIKVLGVKPIKIIPVKDLTYPDSFLKKSLKIDTKNIVEMFDWVPFEYETFIWTDFFNLYKNNDLLQNPSIHYQLYNKFLSNYVFKNNDLTYHVAKLNNNSIKYTIDGINCSFFIKKYLNKKSDHESLNWNIEHLFFSTKLNKWFFKNEVNATLIDLNTFSDYIKVQDKYLNITNKNLIQLEYDLLYEPFKKMFFYKKNYEKNNSKNLNLIHIDLKNISISSQGDYIFNEKNKVKSYAKINKYCDSSFLNKKKINVSEVYNKNKFSRDKSYLQTNSADRYFSILTSFHNHINKNDNKKFNYVKMEYLDNNNLFKNIKIKNIINKLCTKLRLLKKTDLKLYQQYCHVVKKNTLQKNILKEFCNKISNDKNNLIKKWNMLKNINIKLNQQNNFALKNCLPLSLIIKYFNKIFSNYQNFLINKYQILNLLYSYDAIIKKILLKNNRGLNLIKIDKKITNIFMFNNLEFFNLYLNNYWCSESVGKYNINYNKLFINKDIDKLKLFIWKIWLNEKIKSKPDVLNYKIKKYFKKYRKSLHYNKDWVYMNYYKNIYSKHCSSIKKSFELHYISNFYNQKKNKKEITFHDIMVLKEILAYYRFGTNLMANPIYGRIPFVDYVGWSVGNKKIQDGNSSYFVEDIDLVTIKKAEGSLVRSVIAQKYIQNFKQNLRYKYDDFGYISSSKRHFSVSDIKNYEIMSKYFNCMVWKALIATQQQKKLEPDTLVNWDPLLSGFITSNEMLRWWIPNNDYNNSENYILKLNSLNDNIYKYNLIKKDCFIQKPLNNDMYVGCSADWKHYVRTYTEYGKFMNNIEDKENSLFSDFINTNYQTKIGKNLLNKKLEQKSFNNNYSEINSSDIVNKHKTANDFNTNSTGYCLLLFQSFFLNIKTYCSNFNWKYLYNCFLFQKLLYSINTIFCFDLNIYQTIDFSNFIIVNRSKEFINFLNNFVIKIINSSDIFIDSNLKNMFIQHLNEYYIIKKKIESKKYLKIKQLAIILWTICMWQLNVILNSLTSLLYVKNYKIYFKNVNFDLGMIIWNFFNEKISNIHSKYFEKKTLDNLCNNKDNSKLLNNSFENTNSNQNIRQFENLYFLKYMHKMKKNSNQIDGCDVGLFEYHKYINMLDVYNQNLKKKYDFQNLKNNWYNYLKVFTENINYYTNIQKIFSFYYNNYKKELKLFSNEEKLFSDYISLLKKISYYIEIRNNTLILDISLNLINKYLNNKKTLTKGIDKKLKYEMNYDNNYDLSNLFDNWHKIIKFRGESLTCIENIDKIYWTYCFAYKDKLNDFLYEKKSLSDYANLLKKILNCLTIRNNVLNLNINLNLISKYLNNKKTLSKYIYGEFDQSHQYNEYLYENYESENWMNLGCNFIQTLDKMTNRYFYRQRCSFDISNCVSLKNCNFSKGDYMTNIVDPYIGILTHSELGSNGIYYYVDSNDGFSKSIENIEIFLYTSYLMYINNKTSLTINKKIKNYLKNKIVENPIYISNNLLDKLQYNFEDSQFYFEKENLISKSKIVDRIWNEEIESPVYQKYNKTRNMFFLEDKNNTLIINDDYNNNKSLRRINWYVKEIKYAELLFNQSVFNNNCIWNYVVIFNFLQTITYLCILVQNLSNIHLFLFIIFNTNKIHIHENMLIKILIKLLHNISTLIDK